MKGVALYCKENEMSSILSTDTDTIVVEPCKPIGTRHAESIRTGFGTFFFLTDRAQIGLGLI